MAINPFRIISCCQVTCSACPCPYLLSDCSPLLSDFSRWRYYSHGPRGVQFVDSRDPDDEMTVRTYKLALKIISGPLFWQHISILVCRSSLFFCSIPCNQWQGREGWEAHVIAEILCSGADPSDDFRVCSVKLFTSRFHPLFFQQTLGGNT